MRTHKYGRMSDNMRQDYLGEVLFLTERGEWDGVTTDDLGTVPLGYRGEVLVINDHGNVSLYYVFRNGNCREIASRV